MILGKNKSTKMTEIPEFMCRICEKQVNELTNITVPQNWILITKYLACANVTFDLLDKLPKYFCGTCVENLNLAYDFKKQCEFTQQKLYELLNRTLTAEYLELPLPLVDFFNEQKFVKKDSFDIYLNEQSSDNNLNSPIKQESELNILDGLPLQQQQQESTTALSNHDVEKISENCTTNDVVIESNNDDDVNQNSDCPKCDQSFATVYESKMHRQHCSNKTEINDPLKIYYKTKLPAKKIVRKTKIDDKTKSPEKKIVRKTKIDDKSKSPAKKIVRKTRSSVPASSSIFNKKPSTYECDQCDKKFRQSGDLKRHQIVHTNERPFSCDKCNATFRQSSNLIKHARIHSGDRPYQCKICEKSFRNSGTLKSHLRIHTGERPFTCPECKATFRQSGCLTKHLRLHSNNRPFACSLCLAKFRQSYDLKLHMRLHTGERPFLCDVCKKQFRHKAILVEHMNLHTNKMKFQCPLCDKKFKQNSTLRGHIQTHNPLKCNLCPRSYGSKSKLSYHQRMKHNIFRPKSGII